MTPIEEREQDFRNKVNLKIAFPYELRKEFADYWTEPNKSGTKMLFELEKTWDLGRRLARWANNNFGNKRYGTEKAAENSPKTPPVAIKEIIELDQLLSIYRKHPTSIRFIEFGKWYEYLKEAKLLRPLYQHEINKLKESYPGDNYKCRCACVEMTLKWYADGNFTFSNVMEARLKLA